MADLQNTGLESSALATNNAILFLCNNQDEPELSVHQAKASNEYLLLSIIEICRKFVTFWKSFRTHHTSVVAHINRDINGLAVCMKMGSVPSVDSVPDPCGALEVASSSPAHGYGAKYVTFIKFFSIQFHLGEYAHEVCLQAG
jgi:hypothetical protein